MTPPQTEVDLLHNALDLQGVLITELASQLGLALRDPKRWKGVAGQVVETWLGATAGTDAAPDFPHLGVECKTIPLGRQGVPRESTWVTRVALLDDQETWPTSAVRRKLARVLWVPLLGEGADRVIGRARLWSPDADEEARLRADWQDLMELVVLGRTDELHARLGEVLQIRPKGANAASRAPGLDVGGHGMHVLPLGFYLRSTFTAGILRRT